MPVKLDVTHALYLPVGAVSFKLLPTQNPEAANLIS